MLIDRLEAAYNSIIFDCGNGMEYMEYEASYGNYQLTIIVERGCVVVYGTDCIHEFVVRYEIIQFVNETLEQFKTRLNYALYYNTTEVEYLM